MPTVAALQERLLAWFADHQRDLPWRRTYLPYHIWISEIMLQQTQMDRAVIYFKRWLDRFPGIAAVAAAAEEEVLKLWEGLGYYSRARNILQAANILVRDYGCQLPADYLALLRLPGIGRYTAGAIMSLAFNETYPAVDANIERVFARLFDLAAPVKGKETHDFIERRAAELIPAGQARNFNQALMELGALVCLAASPACTDCPLRFLCLARERSTVSKRPVVTRGKAYIPIEMATGILIHEGRVFIQKRPPTGVWANLWEFPGGRLEPGETPEQALIREYQEETELPVDRLGKVKLVKHNYTRYRVMLHCYFCRLADGAAVPRLHAAQEYRWVTPAELGAYAFPAGHRLLLEHIKREPAYAWFWCQR